jgi:Ser-tRNA(Ala) deacylase AlaX
VEFLHQPESARIVVLEGFEPCGCGGTHVKNTQELGTVSIRKIRSKSGIVRISYDIA